MKSPDVAVLGAGLIGLAIARELAGRGLAVEVLEARRAGAGASSAGAGLLAPISDWDSTRAFLDICRRARDGWKPWLDDLVAESGHEVEYDAAGALMVALSPDDEAWLDHERDIARTAGEAWSEMTVAEARDLVPDLAPSASRVARLPGEHRVDNVACCAALAAACRRRGVTIREGFAAKAVRLDTRSVEIDGPGESLRAGRLVVAAGAWSGRIAGLPSLPVRPVRGQMLRLEGAAWPWRGSARWRERYVVRRGAAGLLVGATVEEAGFAEHPTAEAAAALLGFARALFPPLGAARLESVWAGLRPGSPDGRPILGELGSDRVIAATGHYRNGILLAPWTGSVVARFLAGDGPIERGDLFSPDRFAAAAR